MTGYWVAIISEDWRWRMITPSRGDFPSIPINLAAQKIAEAWDPAKDEAAGEQCKAYGAPGLMRGPTRLHITWLDDDTLKLETDYGMQTRLFEFGATPGGTAKPSWQGTSVAQWVMAGGGRADGARRRRAVWVDEVGHDEPAARLSAQEWRALQRKDLLHRILGPPHRNERRSVPGRHQRRERSGRICSCHG